MRDHDIALAVQKLDASTQQALKSVREHLISRILGCIEDIKRYLVAYRESLPQNYDAKRVAEYVTILLDEIGNFTLSVEQLKKMEEQL